MENTNIEQRPWFFNLNTDGAEAVVRFLHSSPSTIEECDTHTVTINGKKRRLRCNGDSCRMCADGNDVNHRIFIHLWNYTDDREMVWDRTDKIISQLNELYESWNPLNSAVVKIKRIGNEFPKYEITPVNPAQYSAVSEDLIDKKLMFRYTIKRSDEDIDVFLKTGTFPEKKPYIPKDQYYKQKEAANKTTSVVEEHTQDSTSQNVTPVENQDQDNVFVDTFDPFADSIFTKSNKF